jgi:hypothetical protein
MSVDAVDWSRLREFAGTDLTMSFLLSGHYESQTLFLDTDLLLTPEHPAYETPRPRERVCIRPAVIEFPFCDRLEADSVPTGGAIAEVARRLGHGAIAGLRRFDDGRYEIDGEFGRILVHAERPVLRLKSP